MYFNYTKTEGKDLNQGGFMVKNPSANAGARVPFLGPEDPLEKEMAAHSSIPAWRIPWTEEPGGQRVAHD